MTHIQFNYNDDIRLWTDSADFDQHGHKVWQVDDNGYVIATVTIRTERRYSQYEPGKRIKDMSKAFVTIRLGYQLEFALPQAFIAFGGERAALREIVSHLMSKNFWLTVLLDLRIAARESGISERTVFCSEKINRSDKDNAATLLRLIKQKD